MQFLNKTLIFSMICLVSASFAKSEAKMAQTRKNNSLKISKLDLNHKGSADALLFENSSSSMALKIRNSQISEIEFQKHTGTLFVKTKYALQNNKYVLIYAYAASSRFFFNENDCSQHNDPLNLLGSLGADIETKQTVIFSDSCNSFSDLKKQISSDISDISNKAKQDAMVGCIFPYDTEAAIKWKSLPQSDVHFGCVDENSKFSGVFDSKANEIKISNACLKSKNTFPNVLNEEILHSFGIKDEAIAKCLAQCPNKIAVQSCKQIKPLTADIGHNSFYSLQVETSLDGSISQNAANDYNSAKTIEVPREIAVAQVPQPQVADLKMSQSVESYTVTDTPARGDGSGSGVGASRSGAVPSSADGSGGRSYSSSSYPSSMMQFASSAILPERAYAASSSSSSSSSSNSNSRSSGWAASTSAAHGAEIARRQAGERAPASESLTGSGENSGSARGGVSLSLADRSSTSQNSSGAAAKLQARGYRSPSSDGTSTSGSSSGFSDGGSGGSNGATAKSARSPASSTSNASELTRYFQTAPYSEVKRRLQDPSFIQDLKRNSTTVFDTQGHQYGASQGQIIFSDKGNRFVKEK